MRREVTCTTLCQKRRPVRGHSQEVQRALIICQVKTTEIDDLSTKVHAIRHVNTEYQCIRNVQLPLKDDCGSKRDFIPSCTGRVLLDVGVPVRCKMEANSKSE